MIKFNFWVVIGFMGQLMFSFRFIIQWLQSEKEKRSVVPFAFWIFSILGSVLLLTYALYKRDPVFIFGQSFGLIIYFRNIYLIKKEVKVKEGSENKDEDK